MRSLDGYQAGSTCCLETKGDPESPPRLEAWLGLGTGVLSEKQEGAGGVLEGGAVRWRGTLAPRCSLLGKVPVGGFPCHTCGKNCTGSISFNAPVLKIKK